MKADHFTFSRATGVALLGLGLQLVMGLALLVVSIIFNDTAGMAGSFLVLAGSLVWITMAVVFDQHRRERLEAMESESLAQASAREASVFGERPDDLLVAARRLGWMHKWLVPLASLIFASLMGGLGVWQFLRGRDILEHDSFASHGRTEAGWLIAVGIAMGAIGFLFARFVSGMAKQPAWANLRAGAAQAVAAAVVGLAIAIAQFIDTVGTDAVARYLLVVIPVLMLVIAGETVLNFLLGLYRPRRAGEVPRPAFDSRILGFIAAPDRIAESIGGALNYQFGFDVTGSWFYQLLSRSLTVLVLVGLVVVWGLTAVGVVQPNEQGLRVRMGRQVGQALGPGAYLKLPWPLERIERFDATTARRLDLGGEQPKVAKSILWTNDHGVAESYFVVRPSEADVEAGREILREQSAAQAVESASTRGGGSDVSLITAEIPLIFEVTDFARFEQLAAAGQREQIVKAIAQREAFKFMATQTVDRVLGRGRSEISHALFDRVNARLSEIDAGVRVLHVAIEGVHPPKETAELFESVVQSLQKRQGSIELGTMEANRELVGVAGSVEMARKLVAAIDAIDEATARNAPAAERAELELAAEQLLSRAEGEAAAKLQAAKAERWGKHMTARGKAERYAGQLASYRASPAVYTAKLYFQALADVLRGSRVYIVADEGNLEVRTDVMDAAASGNLFDVKRESEE